MPNNQEAIKCCMDLKMLWEAPRYGSVSTCDVLHAVVCEGRAAAQIQLPQPRQLRQRFQSACLEPHAAIELQASQLRQPCKASEVNQGSALAQIQALQLTESCEAL